MKKWIFVSISLMVLLSGCQALFFQSAQNTEKLTAATTEPTSTEVSVIAVTPTITPYPLGERFRIKNYYLNTPKNWFFTVVNEEKMLGWVYTPNDPLLMAEQGFKGWSAILWLVTPLPAGGNAEEMRTEMFESIQSYGDDEFQAVLLPAQQTGLIELTDEPITLLNAAVVQWGGVDTIRLDGKILFNNGTTVEVDVRVYLMWNADEFISFYQFSDHTLTESLTPAFDTSRESIEMPQ